MSVTQPASETEQRILDAAREVFMRDGLEGARMQVIAAQAGINKALLHYYFRSKDQLFERIFYEAVGRFFPVVAELMRSPLPIEQKIPLFVDRYIDMLLEHPQLPVFMLHEMHQHADRLQRMMGAQAGQPVAFFLEQYRLGVQEGRYRNVDPRQFLMSMIAVCVFPFAARPMLGMMLRLEPGSFPELMRARKAVVTEQLLFLLRP